MSAETNTDGAATSKDGPSSNALVVEWATKALGESLKDQVNDFQAPGKEHALPALPSEQNDTLTFVANEYKSATAKVFDQKWKSIGSQPSIDKMLNPEWAAQSNLEPPKITNEDLEDIEEDLKEEEARLSRSNPGKSRKKKKNRGRKKGGKSKKWTPEGALKERAKKLKAQREKRERKQRLKNAPAKNLQERARRQIVEVIAQKREQAQATRKERLQIRKKMFLRRLKEFVRKRKSVKRKYLHKRRAPGECLAADEREELTSRAEQLQKDGALKMGTWQPTTGEKSSVPKKVAWSPECVFKMKKTKAGVVADKKHIARNLKRLTQEVPVSMVDGLPWKPRADGKKSRKRKGKKMNEAPMDGVLPSPLKVTYLKKPRLVIEIKASGSRVVLKGIKRESRSDRQLRLQAQEQLYLERSQNKMARIHPWRRRSQSKDVLGQATSPDKSEKKGKSRLEATPGDSYTTELVDKYFRGSSGGKRRGR